MNKSDSKIEESLLTSYNKSSFLPNKEQVKFHSIILIELFTFEDFPELINGLEKLYVDLSKSTNAISQSDYSTIEEIKNELKGSLRSGIHWSRLPPIINSNSKWITPFGVSKDLGENFEFLEIYFYNLSNSLVALEFHVNLESNAVSDKLNKLIYKEYSEDEVTTKYPNGRIKSISNPLHFKQKEVKKLRFELKKEIIEFLSTYFNGYFFKLSENYSIVPNVDLYSLNYPEKNEDIIKWGKKVQDFLGCFGVSIHNFFRSNGYILALESNFSNYVIFANRSLPVKYGDDIDHQIEYDTNYIDFVILAVYKLVDHQESILGDLNSTISNEIQNLEKNELNELLKNRKKISEKIYYFKRFKIEFEQIINKKRFDFNFKSIENRDVNNDLLEILIKGISEMVKNIDESIYTLNEHSNLILNIKNVEYNHNMQEINRETQEKVKSLQIIVIILTIFTILVSITQTVITLYK